MATPHEESTPTTGSTPGPSRTRAPRTSHACDRCRTLRTKCTGEVICARCASDNARCVYNDRKRERNKKTQAECWEQIDTLRAERDQLLGALHSITLAYQTHADQTPQLADLVRRYGDPARTGSPRLPFPNTDLDPALASDDVEAQGERRVLSDVGSNAGSRTLSRAVDLGQGGGTAGFVGKTSAVTWMSRVAVHVNLPWQDQRQTTLPQQPSATADRETANFERFKFFDDEENLLVVDEDYINPYELPSKDVALLLTEAFLQATSRLCSFYDEKTFLEKTIHYTQTQQRGPINDTQWLAQANMAWALGARWLKVLGLQPPGSRIDDHSYFYARARALGIDHRVRLDHPSLELVAALGVLAVYLYSNGSISRAFNISGETIRHAIAHGLHLNLEPEATTHTNIVFRTRLWNSLQAMEILLAELIGRPRSTTTVDSGLNIPNSQNVDFTAELVPAASESNQLWNQFLSAAANMNPALRIKTQVFQYNLFDQEETRLRQAASLNLFTLGCIDDDVARTMYTMPIMATWDQSQRQIAQLDARLQSWRTSLPPALEWQIAPQRPCEIRPKLELAIRYLSLQMILHRVNLCEISMQGQSNDSQQMDSISARACVNAAYELLVVLINESGQVPAVQILPWWRLLHPTCLSLSALLLELCLDAQHMPAQTSELLLLLPKALDSLVELSRISKSASNAYNIFSVLVSKVLLKYPGYAIV